MTCACWVVGQSGFFHCSSVSEVPEIEEVALLPSLPVGLGVYVLARVVNVPSFRILRGAGVGRLKGGEVGRKMVERARTLPHFSQLRSY
jgi:hypothetical protein